MARLLVIDDDRMICDTMNRIFSDMEHDVNLAYSLKEGLEKANQNPYDVVFLDVRLPDGDGLSHIGEIQAAPSLPEVVIITGFADADGAEIAIKNNAWDYIRKPASIDAMSMTLKRALDYRREKLANRPRTRIRRENIIGESPKIQECLELVARAAQSHANILITGETGTGKELFARAIHNNSSRSEKNFVVVDCGSLPETLMESILFGHAKGAFTGADKATDGLVKHADGGTLFFDEIGELTLSAQKSLLRVLQEKRFHPVGSTKEIESDFRLVAATNRDLEEMVRRRKFRDDLLFRLRSITLELPPLRERVEDIRPLTEHYIERLCGSHGLEVKDFSPEFCEELCAYRWPGNVRELFSALEWVMAQSLYEPVLYPKHLPPQIRIEVARAVFGEPAQAEVSEASVPEKGDRICVKNIDGILLPWKKFRRRLLDQEEQRYLRALMEKSDGDIKAAAVMSGLSRPRLYELLRKHGLQGR